MNGQIERQDPWVVRCGTWTDKAQTGVNGWMDRWTEMGSMNRQRGSLAGALAASSLAVKVVVEAGRGAAGRVTAAVVEEAPALQRCALPPGVAHAQGAVATIPATARAVALAVAVLVPALGLAGGTRALRLLGGLRRRGHLAAGPGPARSARAAEEGSGPFRDARAPVEARGDHAAGVGGPRRQLLEAAAGRP